MSKPKAQQEFDDPGAGGSLLTMRFVLVLLLVIAGIAWIAYYYLALRHDPASGSTPSGPAVVTDLGRWNYVIGFGAIAVALVLSAHPATPLGRGRGVVIGMLGCFLLGLLWICTYYVFSNDLSLIPVMNDLGNWNLTVGIVAMAVGFTFSTRWE